MQRQHDASNTIDPPSAFLAEWCRADDPRVRATERDSRSPHWTVLLVHGIARHLCRYFAVALAPHGITVNTIGPGWIEDSVLNTRPDPLVQMIRDHHRNGWTPMRRLGTPAEIGNAVSCSARTGRCGLRVNSSLRTAADLKMGLCGGAEQCSILVRRLRPSSSRPGSATGAGLSDRCMSLNGLTPILSSHFFAAARRRHKEVDCSSGGELVRVKQLRNR